MKIMENIKLDFKNRRFLISLLSVLLVLFVAAGSAFAYLKSVTDTQTNVFVPSGNIRARLTEPNWKPAEGLKLVPGKVVRKDPMITNTGQIDEYVAVRLTFLDKNNNPLSDEDLLMLLGFLDISWSNRWKPDPDTIVLNDLGIAQSVTQPLMFYYKQLLSPGAVSDPLFSDIRVHDEDDELTEDELRWLQGIEIVDGAITPDDDGLGRFSIRVEGAAIQAEGFENAAAAEGALKALFP